MRNWSRRSFRVGNLEKALEISRKLAALPDDSIRAGALLRQARILRKLGRPGEALQVYTRLSRITSVSISAIPADLLARRARCAFLEEQSRDRELRQEASSIEADMRSSRWRLDRTTYVYVGEQLGRWLGSGGRDIVEHEALAAAVDWLHQKRTLRPPEQGEPRGIQSVSFDGIPMTIVWASRSGGLSAFIAGPQYLQTHWLPETRKAAHPARAYLVGADGKPVTGDAVASADAGRPRELFPRSLEISAERSARAAVNDVRCDAATTAH